MRKSKFITGTLSLTMAMAVGATSFAQLSGGVNNDQTESKLVYEYQTNIQVEEPVLEKEANDVNVLTAAKNVKAVGELKIEAETSSPIESKMIKDVKDSEKKVYKTASKSKNKKLKKMGTYKITAYCGCVSCCGKSNGITASGKKAKEGRTIAADTSVLPFGTKVVIDGKTYTVEDRGGAIKGKRIDVYFDSHREALKWGVKYLKVYVKNNK